MIVRNWMKSNPTTVTSSMLISQINRIFSDQSIRALPVVDDGTLRGLLTRAQCSRAAENVARTQDKHEFEYFTNKLKVKDIMVHFPHTIDADDSMEHCLRIGQEDGNSQFPVLDNGKVVGIITATEIFHMAAHIIGAWDNFCGLTLIPQPGVDSDINKIAKLVADNDIKLESIYSLPSQEGYNQRIIVRFETSDMVNLVKCFEKEGFTVFEKSLKCQATEGVNEN